MTKLNKKAEKNISKLIDEFEKYHKAFDSNNPFSGPSYYFYMKKIIWANRNRNYNSLFETRFIEYLYAGLTSWGMHRMGSKSKGAKMNEFSIFRNCIKKNRKEFAALKKFNIKQFSYNCEFINLINKLYFNLSDIMKSNSKLVGVSKIMHFFLPDLIPPMDRQYTMRFFHMYLPVLKPESHQKDKDKEFNIFKMILKCFALISNENNISFDKLIDDKFSPSIPKLIDNAIVAFIKTNKKY